MPKKEIPLGLFLLIAAFGISVLVRLYHITDHQFLFYDEGMYLGYNRNFLNLVAANFPKDITELFAILGVMFKAALTTAKSLWFFLLNLRVFFLGPEAWEFARFISTICGLATVGLTYVFAFRYFQSQRIAVLSAVFLALLPSHVFYSRLGMQESLSTLLFLAALSVYLFFKDRLWSAVLAALLLSLVFFTNYRMIIAPVFIAAIELFEAYKNKQKPDWTRVFWCAGIFALIVFVIGSLYGGVNRQVTFGWMFHQAKEAQGQGDLFSFLSYPYYTFILEGVLFALFFWGNCYLAFKKKWPLLLPFALVLLQMGLFSFAAEKGARYLCVVLPLMCVAAAVSADSFFSFKNKTKYVWGLLVLACLTMSVQSFKIAVSTTDYAKAVEIIISRDPSARILSTQPLVEQLFVRDEHTIQACPKNLADFMALYKEGFRYLILDPQVYISWTKDDQRFSPPLVDYLQYIRENVQPKLTLEHLNKPLLERFVLDHNQNLGRSIRFLNEIHDGKIRIYDVQECLEALKRYALKMQSKSY